MSAPTNRILFVDDEPKVLAGLRRMLRAERHDWELDFAEGAEEALTKLEKESVAIVVSDMRMPGMNGAEFLRRVQQGQPASARLCLSGYSDGELILRGLGSIHQYLNKPCQSAHLARTLRNIMEAASKLPRLLHQRLCALTCLPATRTSLHALREAANKPYPGLPEIEEVVVEDLGLASRILQLAHSGFFGVPRHVESVADACRLLGLARLRMLCQLEDGFSTQELDQEWLANLGRQAMRSSRRAAALARGSGLSPRECDQHGLAGALQGLAELACTACCWPEVVPEAGLFLMRLWGLPEGVVEAVS